MTKTDSTKLDTQVLDRLRSAGIRPTRQRLALAKLLFGNGDRHVSVEMLYAEAQAASIRVSLVTIYNTLHEFTAANLLRETVFDSRRSYFDTNMSDHHHFIFEGPGWLHDIPGDQVVVTHLPDLPAGTSVKRIDVVIRLKEE